MQFLEVLSMKNRVGFLLLIFLSSRSVAAQNAPNQFGVYVPTAAVRSADANAVKLSLKQSNLQVTKVESPPDLPIHIVFVLDNGSHQQALTRLALDYVQMVAADIRDNHPRFTVLLAAKEPTVVADIDTASGLLESLSNVRIAMNSGSLQSEDLAGGVSRAIHILDVSDGVRVVVILSDGDDDIADGELSNLKMQLAETHTLCFSLLLAEHDFFGTKVRSAWGVQLQRLANYSGGGQYETHWQNRKGDPKVLASLAEQISSQTLISFEIPTGIIINPGTYRLKAEIAGDPHTLRTSPLSFSHRLE
jgi:hypothetical protein